MEKLPWKKIFLAATRKSRQLQSVLWKSAEAEKNCQDYDQQLEAQTTAQIRQIRQKLEEEKDTRLSALRAETEATFSALDTYYDENHVCLSKELFQKILEL